jgi:hypothetical protein
MPGPLQRLDRRAAAATVALAVLLVLPAAAGAATPRSGAYTARAAGMTKLEVTFAIDRGRIVRPRRGPALEVSGLRCARGRDREAWTQRVSVRRGVLRGSWYSGIFDARGTWLRGEAFEITGRWSSAGLVTGRMRWRRTVGRRCSSGWVRWRAAPIDPVTVASAAPRTFVVPGSQTITATIANDGDTASKDTRALVTVTGVLGTVDQGHPLLVGAQPSQGVCDPGLTVDPGLATLSVGCRLGTVPARSQATIVLTIAWPPDSCTDRQSGSSIETYATSWYTTVISPLNELDIGWTEPDATDELRTSEGQCPPAPPRPPAPVDEP